MEIQEYKKMDELERSNWWYLGRRNIIQKLFSKYANIKNSKQKIIDIGCGTGEGINIFDKEKFDIYGIEPSEEAISIALSKGYKEIKKGEGTKLSFKDNEFNSAFMFDVLEHIEDDRLALKECNRVLSRNSLLFMTVPAHLWLWSGHDEVFGHKRRYSKEDLINKIKDSGFDIVFESFFMTTLFPVVALFRIFEKFFRNKRSSHFFNIPNLTNKILLSILKFEGSLMKIGIRLPFGISIIVVAQKEK